MCCSWLRESPSPTLHFIDSDPQYKRRNTCSNPPIRGRCCGVFASSRRGPRLPLSLTKFFNLANTLLLQSAWWQSNPHGQLLLNLHGGLRSPHSGLQRYLAQTIVLPGLVRYLSSPSTAVYTSYFSSYSIVVWLLNVFLEAKCSSWPILVIMQHVWAGQSLLHSKK